MKSPSPLSVLLAAAVLPLAAHAGAPGVDNPVKPDGKPHAFTFGGEGGEAFLIDGAPVQIRAGEIHFQRVPREYWRHRVRQAKAMGLNTIATYVFWNALERADGTFDFATGSNDLAGFLKVCAAEGMWVNLRPGPYTCAVWDFGGLPTRLLKKRDLKIRTTQDALFMAEQEKYLRAVADVARPFLAKNGGPILLTQLENEYGSYRRKDRAYLLWLHEFWTKAGFGPFNTADGAADHYLKGVTLPGVAVGLDPGRSDKDWAVARKHNPGVPVFSAETYPGWLRHWGEGNWGSTDCTGTLDFYMKSGKSFCLYVVHGGTNFGFTAGANGGGRGGYQPDLTSYDYGSPSGEQGKLAPEYAKYRKKISDHLPADAQPPAPEAAIPTMEIAPFTPVRIAGLWDALPAPMRQETPEFFESWDQNQGLAVYATELPAGPAAPLAFANLHDYGLLYLDGKALATIDRRSGAAKPVALPARDKPAKLELLVEGMGHVNFTTNMETDRKGLFGEVTLGGKPVKGWAVHPLPLAAGEVTAFAPVAAPSAREGSRFRATVTLDREPADTFLDLSKYRKGFVWVNGRNLGRYWSVGPQHRLYCPASWLRKGANVIDIVDLHMTEPSPIRGVEDLNREQGKVTRNLDNAW